MKLEDARTGLERLDRETCLTLLAHDTVGRVILVRGGAPEIFPVNYALDGDAVVFRTDAGTKLSVGARAQAAFEIDHFDRATHTGWSVIAFGRLEEVTKLDARTWDRVQALHIDPWGGGEKRHWMRIATTRLSGRRVGDASPARWSEMRRTIGPGAAHANGGS